MFKILALWATPRSTSTAFEWMMRQRGDFICHHEPFNELYYCGEDRHSQRDADVAAKPGFSFPNALREMFDRVCDKLGKLPPVMTSEDLVTQPAATVEAYCAAVGIDFKPEALQWEAGERKEVAWYGEGTGPWHDTLRQSTGIEPPKTKYSPIEEDAHLMNIYEDCLPDYKAIQAHRLVIGADCMTYQKPERWKNPAIELFPHRVGFTCPPHDYDAARRISCACRLAPLGSMAGCCTCRTMRTGWANGNRTLACWKSLSSAWSITAWMSVGRSGRTGSIPAALGSRVSDSIAKC